LSADYCPGTGTPARGHAVCPVCAKTVPSKGGRLRRHVPPDDPGTSLRIAAVLERMRQPDPERLAALERYAAERHDPELPHDPTGVDCAERYEGGDI
jgi:hypothetical protein